MSPWLHFECPIWPNLAEDVECEVAVIGAGISGVVTAYYLLTATNKNVFLFEQGRVAHQASGNNAGIACAHIEKPIQDLVHEFGLDKTRQSFLELDQAWDLMLHVLDTINAKELLIPFPKVTLALSSLEVLVEHLGRENYNRKFNRTKWQYYVLDDLQIKNSLPANLCEYVKFGSRDEIVKILNVADSDFIGVAVPLEDFKLARLNSAALCYRIIDFLQTNYADRLQIFENTPISSIEQQDTALMLKHPNGEAIADDVILCTNGYKDFEIRDRSGNSFNKLKNALIPREGYLAGYIDTTPQIYAQAFFDDRGAYPDSPYFYLTHAEQLTIVGGPEFDQPDGCHASEIISKRANSSKEIYQKFLKITYNIDNCSFDYFWYGIMGYTSNDVRWVGEESQIQHLWYNLGCNGIGIVTAFAAGKRIASLIQGLSLPATIFDPGAT